MTSRGKPRNARPPRPGGQGTPRGRAQLERRPAAGLLGGLLAFTGGFAVAGALVMAGQGGRPPYLVAVTVGLMGLGLVGVAGGRREPVSDRGEPAPPVWSPRSLLPAAAVLGLPGIPAIVILYALGAVGIVGNILVPLLR